MRRVKRKKYLAGLAVTVLLLALLPTTTLAASADYGDFLVTGDDLSGVSFENDTLMIGTSGTYTSLPWRRREPRPASISR